MPNTRKYLVTIKTNDDLSEYTLVCSLNGKEAKTQTHYSLNDALIGISKFVNDCFEYFDIDTRYDDFRLKIDVTC